MTRRQQLILFVLALATVSICTVAFALTMTLWRQMSGSDSTANRLPAVDSRADSRLAWQTGNTPNSAPSIVPIGPDGQPVFPPRHSQECLFLLRVGPAHPSQGNRIFTG